ncbi:hypothetical protein D3C76_279910 [compost metagenome]
MYPRIVNFKAGKGNLQVKIEIGKNRSGPCGVSGRFFVGTLFTSNAVLYQLLSRCFWNYRFAYASTIDGN